MHARLARRLAALALAVACTLPAHAATYTVGPGGTHSTIQSAIDAALANPGGDEIRVHIGTYAEGISVPATMAGDTLVIEGGYLDGYVLQYRYGAASTLIEPPAGTRGAELLPSGGMLTLRTFTVRNAYGTKDCAGVLIRASGSSQVIFSDSVVRDNVVEKNVSPYGAGGCLDARDQASATLSNVLVQDNVARVIDAGSGGVASSAGFASYCEGSAFCTIVDSRFLGNRAESANTLTTFGVGLNATARDSAVLNLVATQFEAQEAGGASGSASGLSARITGLGSALVHVTQCRFHGAGIMPGGAGAELQVAAQGDARVEVGNSLIVKSLGRGLYATTADTATLVLGQLTVADNASMLKVVSASSESTVLANSVFHAPAQVDITGTTFSANLFGDPGFLAPGLFDYSLRRQGSPAMDAGTFVDLGSYDVNGDERIRGVAADIGAYESSDRLFADRFDH